MKIIRYTLGLLAMSITLGSCIKQSYDNPPGTNQYDPNLAVNLTIGALNQMALNLNIGDFRTMGDSTIEGIVNADDRTGNFYKQIVIQDSTGGMTINIAQYSLYTDFPVGRKVYIKLNGLTLVNYHGLPEIAFSASIASGATSIVGIPTGLIPTYVIKASYPNTITPLEMRMDDLIQNPNPYLNRLVSIENMEFDSTAINMPYAAPSLVAIATSRLVHPCPNPNNSSIEMYNSGYATFQPAITPTGKGNLTGIFSIYNSFQFLIRDTSDVQFTQTRDCQ